MTIPSWHLAAMLGSHRIAAHQVFFVLGCQKSGTTWLQQLLDAHPQACCDGEGHFTDVLAPLMELAFKEYNNTAKVTQALSVEALWSAVRLMIDQAFCRALDRQPHKPGVITVGDKTPEAALAVPALHLLYPRAKFVHIIRDGRDGAVSGWAHLKRESNAGKFATFADYAEYFAAGHWRPYILSARQAAKQFPQQYLELRYEAMLESPEENVVELLRFLGVRADGDSVKSCLAAASFEKLSGGRAAGQEDAASHFRKGVAGDWESHFDDESRRRFEAAAGDLLAELGYANGISAAAQSR